jgi:predicted ribonuclease YlaK
MIKEIELSSPDLINEIYAAKDSPVPYKLEDARENDAFVLKCGSQSVIVIVKEGKLERLPDRKILSHIKGENLEQKVYLHYLYDDEIKCVLPTGGGGCGKTFLAVAYAYESILKGIYNEIIIARPPVAPSKKMQSGFLAGSLEDKMKPWMAVFYDALDKVKFMCGGGSGKTNTKVPIREQSLEFIKGMTFDNAIILVDEAEDLTKQEAKAVLTRVGKNSKIIMMGDIEQSTETGCKYTLPDVIKGFRSADIPRRDQRMFADIDLKTSLRSEFCNLVLKVL